MLPLTRSPVQGANHLLLSATVIRVFATGGRRHPNNYAFLLYRCSQSTVEMVMAPQEDGSH